jgi:hypothetical protein
MSAPTHQSVAVFRYAIAKPLGLIAGGIVLTAACAAVALGLLADPRVGGAVQLAAYAGVVGFGLATIVMIVRLRRRGRVLEITTEGIRDRRLSPDLLLWMDIARASIRQLGRQRVLVLQLHADAQARLRRARGSRAGNWQSLSIGMDGLDGSIDDLTAAIARVAEITILNERS